MVRKIRKALENVREKQPLILNITNYVSMNWVANGLLALGASPIMSCAVEEIDELMAISAALNVNIGTLDPSFMELAQAAVIAAKKWAKPIILDPVGAGATALRTRQAQALGGAADVIRGNYSEIMALSGNTGVVTKGADSAAVAQAAVLLAAHQLVATSSKVVVASGAVDLIVGYQRHEEIRRGSALMPRVTGMGCLLNAVIAAFVACNDEAFEATQMAVAYFSLCAEAAERQSQVEGSGQRPGSFAAAFIDALASPDWECISAGERAV